MAELPGFYSVSTSNLVVAWILPMYLYRSKIFLKVPKYFIKLSLHLQLVCDETQNSAPRVRNDRINDDRYSGGYAEDERPTSPISRH